MKIFPLITTSYILLSGSIPDSRVMKWLVWSGTWSHKRLKASRFGLVVLGGRVVRHARRWILCLARGHPGYPVLLRARERIRELAAATSPAQPPPTLLSPVFGGGFGSLDKVDFSCRIV